VVRHPGEAPMEFKGKKTDGRSSRDALLHGEDQLEDTLRRFNFLAALRERKQIRRVCADSLRLYRQVALEMPQSSRLERYVQVVERRRSNDPLAASRILRLVRGGVGQWPAERQLNFRDVVQIIVGDRLPDHAGCRRRHAAAGYRFRLRHHFRNDSGASLTL
jgi:hypothetical protein